MKVVILCGGKGSRLRSANDKLPKPLAIVKGKPLIWHIINIYRKHGFKEFILPLGYGGEYIKEYFYNYEWKNSDLIIDAANATVKLLTPPEDWKITLVDTGIDTMTGGRIKKIESYISEENFMLTYGDGLCDINIASLVDYHHKMGRIATVTGIKKESPYGIMQIKDGLVEEFHEKQPLEGIINGGFFVLNRKIFSYLENQEQCIFEEEPLRKLSSQRQLAVYMHEGLWMAVDTFKDLQEANKRWNN